MKSTLLRCVVARVAIPAAAFLAALLLPLAPAFAQNTMVRMETTEGIMDIKLLDTEAPGTVANFLVYLREGSYTYGLVHRSAWVSQSVPFVVQAGGFRWPPGSGNVAVTTHDPIANEFSPTRSNVRGTVAMAKQANNPNSATSQWFVNMSNNASNLDNQNGGFTVFARVTTPGMATADRISALPRQNLGSPFSELPVLDANAPAVRTNVVLINAAYELPNANDSDRVFNYLEAAYPEILAPARAIPLAVGSFHVRYYSTLNLYLGTNDTTLYYLLASGDGVLHSLGAVADWLAIAQGAGY
ncbi:MAG TPA: peptidylprolyl isomerase [Ramlibacter sp.]|uniref:peptidylprolyl isomerase n=1 Tax=Ramlibacter sp. TaxID=1917967 RepID=UPI002BD96592|nr:peptidylprolyl isomerase [Ramlibacter sp.]HVZ46273.1 peptidylprolyl isomerase [Ramlibacter sp.]